MRLLLRWPWTLALALALAFPRAASAHPIHTTVLDLEWDERTGVLQGTLRVFADDLEAAARSAGVPPASYLGARLSMWAGGQRVALALCGERRVGDAVLVCVRGRTSAIRDVRIRNAILLERYDDQTNIVRLDAGRTSTVLLSRSAPERSID